MTLVFGEVLYEAHAPMAHVYFPCESMVSLLLPVENHIDIEVGLVGREGMVGASLSLGIPDSPVKALVQGAGSALRLSAAASGASSRAIRRCSAPSTATSTR